MSSGREFHKLKGHPALSFYYHMKYWFGHNPWMIFLLRIGWLYYNYISFQTFLEIATKYNWKEMRLYVVHTTWVVTRMIPLANYAGIAKDNVVLIGYLIRILCCNEIKTSKYMQRVAMDIRIQVLTESCFAVFFSLIFLNRMICLGSEYEYNYALKYLEEKEYFVVLLIAYIFVDSFCSVYNVYAIVELSWLVHGNLVQFVHIIESMESISQRSVTVVDQNHVNSLLKYAAKKHALARRFIRHLSRVGEVTMLTLTFSGIISITACVYLIINAERVYFHVLLNLLMWIATFVLLCNQGQKIENTANEFHSFICNLPWDTWNETNKKIYLFMLMNSKDELVMTCYGVKCLNRDYLKYASRLVYSLGCVVCKMK